MSYIGDALPKRPGDVIAGKYRLGRVVGAGGMGVVYEATHVRRGDRVAIKMLRADTCAVRDVALRFEREAHAAGYLRGTHVARVVDVGRTEEGFAFIAMEYLEGHDLGAELDRKKRIALSEAADYLLQACAAMAEAHALGIVHRDLKPANLFLHRDDDGVTLKVLDFGISKVLTEASLELTATSASIGTPRYMAPEQLRSTRGVDARADVWSLGVVLYEMLAGRPPFVGTHAVVGAAVMHEPVPSLAEYCAAPDAVIELATSALEKNPDERCPDVGSFGAQLLPFVSQDTKGYLAYYTTILPIYDRSISYDRSQDGPNGARRTSVPVARAISTAPRERPFPSRSIAACIGVVCAVLLALYSHAVMSASETTWASGARLATPSAPPKTWRAQGAQPMQAAAPSVIFSEMPAASSHAPRTRLHGAPRTPHPRSRRLPERSQF